uniref:Uncharacterized protein n=1 Tax=Siphoviridae sp. ctHn727 TaxID=2825425 RepID=A0A8S5V899_9CAUD|nr:MAG TPA: hypothetical protein [Siphoviridae sp. ctHn727]
MPYMLILHHFRVLVNRKVKYFRGFVKLFY